MSRVKCFRRKNKKKTCKKKQSKIIMGNQKYKAGPEGKEVGPSSYITCSGCFDLECINKVSLRV